MRVRVCTRVCACLRACVCVCVCVFGEVGVTHGQGCVPLLEKLCTRSILWHGLGYGRWVRHKRRRSCLRRAATVVRLLQL